GPTALGKVGLCDFVSAIKLKTSSASQVTQLRHPSGCAKVVSANTSGLGWFSIFLIIILCLFGGYMIAGATYRFFYLGIHGIDVIPNLELWASLPRKARVYDLLCFYLFVLDNKPGIRTCTLKQIVVIGVDMYIGPFCSLGLRLWLEDLEDTLKVTIPPILVQTSKIYYMRFLSWENHDSIRPTVIWI
ncbi:ceroid-lipofuscinosis neuronal protein 5-like protein, partial [Tanacetum coccineum]